MKFQFRLKNKRPFMEKIFFAIHGCKISVSNIALGEHLYYPTTRKSRSINLYLGNFMHNEGSDDEEKLIGSITKCITHEYVHYAITGMKETRGYNQEKVLRNMGLGGW